MRPSYNKKTLKAPQSDAKLKPSVKPNSFQCQSEDSERQIAGHVDSTLRLHPGATPGDSPKLPRDLRVIDVVLNKELQQRQRLSKTSVTFDQQSLLNSKTVPLSCDRQHLSYGDCWTEVKGEYNQNCSVLCSVCTTVVHNGMHTYMNSSQIYIYLGLD